MIYVLKIKENQKQNEGKQITVMDAISDKRNMLNLKKKKINF